jgi:Na+/H+ antiporter NhaC
MDLEQEEKTNSRNVTFYGGPMVALIPFLVFVSGVVWIALSGAPDEKGFWPVLILALAIGLLLAKDKEEYSYAVLDGMSERIVMIMITAWILASIIGVLMTVTGFVEALAWLASLFQVGGMGFSMAAFIMCGIVSLSTGSSFATILICGPLLYPAGGVLGAHLPTLAGAILAGATFGDFFAPISDTTIASALSQGARIGPTVKSRVKYIIPAAILALLAISLSQFFQYSGSRIGMYKLEGSPAGLPMLLVPALIIYLFLKGKHLFHGLMLGLFFGTVLGLVLGLLPLDQLISLDLENLVAQSFVIKGINRSIGLSIFTILLMGLVGILKGSNLMDSLINFAQRQGGKTWKAEGWIAGVVGIAVLLTTHSIVAILMVAEFARKTGSSWDISAVRRSNLLSVVVCIFPFLLPYFIPVILMSSMTSSGSELGVPSVPPLEVGLHNFLSWALILIAMAMVFLGYGRKKDTSYNNKDIES